MSFRLRLTLLYSGLLASALVLFSLLLFGVLNWTFTQSVDGTLEEVASRVAWNFQMWRDLPPLDRLSDRSTFVMVRVEEGAIAQSGNITGLFPLPNAAKQGHAVFTTEVDSQGEVYRLYTLPMPLAGSYVYVQVAHAMNLLSVTQSNMRLPVALGALLFVAVGALGAWLLARQAISPIVRVAHAAQSIGQSADLSLRVPYKGTNDEVGVLVSTFNDMLDQLEALYARLAASVNAQQRFVADASHELRTPLTIIRGNIDYMKKAGQLDPEALADMDSEARRMTQLIEEMLTMARADVGQTPELEPVALGPLVREACRKAQALPHGQVEFQTDLPEALERVYIMGNSDWLTRALLILIDNAFKYTASGTVTVRAGRQGDGVVIQVQDTGAGIAPEDLPHIFERFYRADRARGPGGTGLGLAIAQWIAGLHAGRLTVESELGKGSTFSLWLPVQRSIS